MSTDRLTRLQQRLAADIQANGEPAPPWVRFPSYGRYCLGWRMGSGEDWLELWWHWVDQTLEGPEQRLAYLKRHGPAPASWDQVVQSVLTGESGPGDLEPEATECLRVLGLIQPDAAYTNWLAQIAGERPVWADFDTPAKAARYDERTLSFWCRSFSEDRARVPDTDCPTEWRAFVACARSGALLEPEPPTEQGWVALALHLAATGTAPPPWVLGLGVEAYTDSLEPDARYADAWAHWVFGVFEDRVDWEAYLVQWEAVPEGWARVIGEHILFV
ncbi:MAG: hypothetical protein VX899_07245 [Myxococcota bacterium]|nr:hypothetical protein [Myxococcota bacterium]